MKNIRNRVILGGLSIMVFALCATGARAQSLSSTNFAGTFTLPFEAQWGRAALPAGEYSLYYGHLIAGSAPVVEVIGKGKTAPHILVLVAAIGDAAAKKNALVCVREGNTGVIRTLEMPEIGEAANFRMPHGTQLMAKRSSGRKNVEVAEGPELIQQIPITLASR